MALLGCVGSLVLGRIVNVQVPLAYKQIVADLSDPTKTSLPLGPLLVFALLKILQNGVMDAVSSLLWVPVSQGITKEVSVRLFDHLLSLGMRWHLKRKPGEIGRIRSRGVGAVVSVLDTLLLRAGPIVLDLVLACAYFSAMFDSVFATIVFGTMAVNLFASFRMSGLRVRHRRAANQLGNKLASKAIDVLGNIETVKYFGNESHESAEYRRAFGTFQSMERRASLADALVNVARVALVQAGMLLGAVECARRVVEFHTYAASDFVLYLTYVGQLYGPINQLQRHYQTLRQSAMQLGSLLELLDEEPEVRDAPGAAELDPGDGGLEFDAVRFTHFPDNPKRPVVVDGVTAAAAPGRTVALVGPSGGGKTTLLKLALRFVDATEGTVRVSGRDVREVTQASLRSAIGVVPQDAALFNASLMDNIRYGRLDATDAEVEEAARSAQIHDKITGFEKGYATVVGERGMRLSGGERQRVAIARAILRNPKVLLLDEATSALDVQTEKAIQEQLHQLSKGRTTLVVAHRLSTIVNADEILVLDEGRIAERGSFEELLALGGLFSSMWQAQLRDPDAGRALAKEAKEPEKPLSPGFGREETDGLQVDEDMGWADIV
ncbi:P-loop containing nucleoside triphosphate hydrolase protein [Hyaloraphidium curvatum]|nr:P-loop containing nucleoside triphosphate hydrolase protein [Hyaloraphidium curvatum]